MTQEELIPILRARFEANPQRHPRLVWEDVEKRLSAPICAVLLRMEETGGEPDAADLQDGTVSYVDCSKEAPASRRGLCYDRAAWLARRANKPASSAEERAAELGAELLNEEQYLLLQELGDFDCKSQCWLKTPAAFRSKGDALFGSKRHGRTFIFYNGPESYYQARGFRCRVVL